MVNIHYVPNGSSQQHATVADDIWIVNSGFAVEDTNAAFLVDAGIDLYNSGGIVSLTFPGIWCRSGNSFILNNATGSINGADGIVADSTSSQTVDVVNYGSIVGNGYYAAIAQGQAYLNIDNYGYMFGKINAVTFDDSSHGSVTNHGVLQSPNSGSLTPAIYVDTDATDAVSIFNYGEIKSYLGIKVVNCALFYLTNTGDINNVETGTGEALVTNSGNIHNYTGGDGVDLITNTGKMAVVNLGGGDDRYDSTTFEDSKPVGTGTADRVYGGSGNDTIEATGASVHLVGGAGNDTYIVVEANASAGLDVIIDEADDSGSGKDTVISIVNFSLSDPDRVKGRVENLALVGDAVKGTGNNLANVITGDDLNNVLSGLGGADTVIGGAGADSLSGGAGSDRFTFTKVTESGPSAATRDSITDFVHGTDHIGVHAIDANTAVAGNQDFTFGGSFTAGHIQAVQSGADTVVNFNTDSDATAEMSILLKNFTASTLAGTDFIL